MRTLFTILLISATLAAGAQTDLKKPPTFVLHLNSFDLKTVQDIVNTSFGDVVSNGRWGNTKDNYTGWGASYLQGISNHIDFMGSLSGALVWYPFRKTIPDYVPGKKLLLEGDVAFNFKLFTDQSKIVPYLTVGIGGYMASSKLGVYAPFGMGAQVRVGKSFLLFGNFQYRAPLTSEAAHHLVYNIGGGIPLSKIFSKNKNYYPPTYGSNVRTIKSEAIVIKDTDGDGLSDDNDNCPNMAGPSYMGGCPVADMDGDGITDSLDKCPRQAGFVKYAGCPLPDKDNDGVADDFDKCPDVPGIQKYFGCPGPDTDGDGVYDDLDRCPSTPGPASNSGCPAPTTPMQALPEIKKETKPATPAPKKEIKPETKPEAKHEIKKDSTILAPIVAGLKKTVKGEPVRNLFFASNQSNLDELTSYNMEQTLKSLRNNPLWSAQIKGFTDDSEGRTNTAIALKRANAIVDYLTGKGIDKSRVTVSDGGVDKSAAFNTADGSGHRRAEITIVQ